MRIWWLRTRERLRLLAHVRGAGDALLLLRILVFAALVPLLVRIPLSRLQVWVEPRHRLPPGHPAAVQRAVELVETGLELGRPLVRRGCLTRGLTLYRFLRRAGADVELCFGVGSVAAAIEGHCWLERDGLPYLERAKGGPNFVAIYRIPSSVRF